MGQVESNPLYTVGMAKMKPVLDKMVMHLETKSGGKKNKQMTAAGFNI